MLIETNKYMLKCAQLIGSYRFFVKFTRASAEGTLKEKENNQQIDCLCMWVHKLFMKIRCMCLIYFIFDLEFR